MDLISGNLGISFFLSFLRQLADCLSLTQLSYFLNLFSGAKELIVAAVAAAAYQAAAASEASAAKNDAQRRNGHEQ
jgi:hypothetical protein